MPTKSPTARVLPLTPTEAPDPGEVLTVDTFCELLSVSRDTFYHWRKVKAAPVCHRLPNGALRIRRADFDSWLDALREAA